MLTDDQLDEIRGYLDKAENPLIFFDEDPDGLCSYLLLRKYMDKGRGVIVKRSRDMAELYVRKVEEYSPDIIFILLKAFPSSPSFLISNITPPISDLWRMFLPCIFNATGYFIFLAIFRASFNVPVAFLLEIGKFSFSRKSSASSSLSTSIKFNMGKSFK